MSIDILASPGSNVPSSGIYPATTSIVLASRVTGDTNDRFQLLADGTMKWGPGNAGTDVTFSRSTGGTLLSSNALRANGNMSAHAADSAETGIGALGPSSQAAIFFGSSVDVLIYRNSATEAKVNVALVAGTYVAGNVGSSGQATIGARGPSGEAALSLGNAEDVKFWRQGSGEVRLGLTAANYFGIDGTNRILKWGGGFLSVGGSTTDLALLNATLQWNAAHEQTTVGAAGAASALPATPTEYVQIKKSDGTLLVVPAYLAA